MIKHSAGVNGCFHSVFVRANEIFDPFVDGASKCAAAKAAHHHGGWTRTIKDPERFLFRLGLSY